MEHTQGPWRVCGLNIGSPNELVVASCYKDTPDSVVMRPKDDEECLANARLIASSPDLLKACKEALDIINSYSHIPAQFKACQILQQAIAKATGKE